MAVTRHHHTSGKETLHGGALTEFVPAPLAFSEILDCDSRPTFVVDLDSDWVVRDEIRPVFCNAALPVSSSTLLVKGRTMRPTPSSGHGLLA
jgi:hypothetical protein